jgi:hypothetical protein
MMSGLALTTRPVADPILKYRYLLYYQANIYRQPQPDQPGLIQRLPPLPLAPVQIS